MDLEQRLNAYVRLFAARLDVHVWASRSSAPSAALDLPGDFAWLGRRSLLFTWSPEPPDGGEKPSEGGILHLDPGHGEGWCSQDDRYFDDVDRSLLFDFVVEEGQGVLLERFDGGGLVPAFYNANDDSLRRFESLEAYFTLGARRAFAGYWADEEMREWEEVLEPLLAASISADQGEAAIRDALVTRGASEEEAEALVAWLGPDARVLVPAE